MKKEELDVDAFDIDKYALDRECVIQPKLIMTWSLKVADLKADLERAKYNKDRSESEVDFSIRSNPESYGIIKITEGSVKAAVIGTVEYRDAHEKVIQAKHALDKAQAVLDSIHQRKTSIENLVQLHLSGYYAEPKMPKGHEEEARNHQKQQTRRRGQQ